MQKNAGKNTKKLYLTTAIISFVLVLAISLTLIFTLGGRSSGGSGNGNNSGTIGSVSTKVYNGETELNNGGLPVSTSGTYNVNVKNTSDMGVYLRARVIVIGTSNNLMIKFGTNWTYAADNYLYYNNKVESGKFAGGAILAPTSTTEDTLFKGFDTSSTTTVTGLTVRFVIEALQEEAAVPQVTVKVDSTTYVENNKVTNTSATTGLGMASCTLIQNGLLKYTIPVAEIASDTNKNASRTFTIANNGKQDLDVKFRIASSEWMVESVTVGSDNTRKVEWFPNAGYYQLVDKLAIGATATITLGDANKNNNIKATDTTIELTLQDYIVATDIYSLVNKTTLKNVGSKVSGKISTYTVSGSELANLAVYSYNNINKFVYVKTSGGTHEYNGSWGNFEGESTGVSGAVIAPKSCSELLYKSGSYNTSGTYTITIQTAQTIDNATISVIKATGTLNDGTTGNYKPVDNVAGTAVATADMILEAYDGNDYASLQELQQLRIRKVWRQNIIKKWGNLAIKSNDSSDMLVRVSLSFAWGTYSGGTWTPNTDALGFSPSVFYGDGFSFNSEDQSLTYNYNLAKGQATSALLDFIDTTTSGTTRETESFKMAQAVVEKRQALKLSVMVEAIYAVGSQLDILKLTGTPTATSGSYYTSDAIGTNYTSMTKTSGIITGTASELASSLSNYVVYVTNNFPVGVRVAVALQWGKLNETTNTWTSSGNSTVNLGQYLSSTNWEFDKTLGGYNYKCSIPGKCATLSIFDYDKLTNETTGLVKAIQDASETSNYIRNGDALRVVIMAETTHKV